MAKPDDGEEKGAKRSQGRGADEELAEEHKMKRYSESLTPEY